jgi:hypothetical protein
MTSILIAAAAAVFLGIGSAYVRDPISAVIYLAHGSRRWRKFI